MDIGIIGLPQTGKKTLFQLLAGSGALEKRHDPMKSIRGMAEVQDPRFDTLLSIYSPRKHTRARIEFTLLPRIEARNISESDLFDEMVDADALCHVVRVFEDDAIYHTSGSVNHQRDIEFVNSELILHDLLFIEKRLERIKSKLKKMKDEAAVGERELLEGLKTHLEDEQPLRLFSLSRDDEKVLASYPLLTRKQLIVVLNVSDDQLGDDSILPGLKERYEALNIFFVRVPAKAELEIASLESEEERVAFMKEMGIDHPALHTLTRACIEALGLVSFFTVTGGELRQWFVPKGSTALRAAGTIHSDLERGFIRAEVTKFEDLVRLGSEEKAKSEGKHYVKGRDYTVEDGDILHVRFNV
ncbi:MAG: redox-regulated ATPase YchF [Candidatus Latescibacteria bacterium]|nr:redox-regulated ATPase YchF [Candidatus Latescibacterota bacterium]NIO27206.1 redox-regulated ATPase YchF [Candidatus Latescibacterota bacterium]NIO54730.1 redox-regulated ATPase YchF [Candidatus Latescibacterota bacterium]NIT00813.1 redox-regulated ATPase YchF [Candidatus Latescibacterota bacterium]NIT37736.1 redox-regulated ATPase YchF [Candidatus Latescibacterota bacterium]